MAGIVHHASLHCDTVSAAQLATSLLPRSPSAALQLSGTVSFPETEEEKKSKVTRCTGKEAFPPLLAYTVAEVLF